MKYIDRSCVLLPILCATLLGACTSAGPRESASASPESRLELVDTSQYLPVKSLDENGLPIRYRPRQNPYTQLQNQIDKQAVETFIQARRALSDYDLPHAEQLLVALRKEQPQLSGPLVLHGDLEAARGNLPAAVEHYQTAIEITPVNFNAWIRLAKAQRMQGQFERAQNTYAEALRRWPDGAALHWNLGVLYDLYLNMPEQAQAHMEAYQMLSGDNSGEVAAWLSEIRQRTGIETVLRVQGPRNQSLASIREQLDPDSKATAVASKSSEEQE